MLGIGHAGFVGMGRAEVIYLFMVVPLVPPTPLTTLYPRIKIAVFTGKRNSKAFSEVSGKVGEP